MALIPHIDFTAPFDERSAAALQTRRSRAGQRGQQVAGSYALDTQPARRLERIAHSTPGDLSPLRAPLPGPPAVAGSGSCKPASSPLRRAIQRHIKDALSENLIQG